MQVRNRIFKIALIGDASTGKTALLQRYLTGHFTEESRATLGVNFCTKTLEVSEERISLQIWDFGGSARFDFLVSSYCIDIDAVMFVYDVTNAASLYKLERWVKKLRAEGKKIIFLVIGSKCDLMDQWQKQSKDAAAYAQAQGAIGIIEASSKTGENVLRAFETIVTRLLNHHEDGNSPFIL